MGMMMAMQQASWMPGRVVIIGGGVSGALIGARLAEAGFAVVILEKGSIGNGSSGRSAAGIRAQWGTPETVMGMLFSEWFYDHFHDVMHSPQHDRPWIIRHNGYLFLYEDSQQTQPFWRQACTQVQMQQSLGGSVEVLSPDEVHRRWPHILSAGLVGATWGEQDGFLNHDLIFRRGFARAQELGAELLQHAEVLGAEVHSGRISALRTTIGLIEGDIFINAAGAWSPRVSRRLGGMDLAISPIKRFLYFLRPERPIMSSEAWKALPMTIYGVGPGRGAHSRPDGTTLLIGMAHQAEPEPDFADAEQDLVPSAFHHAHGFENLGYTALAEIERFAPDLANCGGLVSTNSGYYEMTPDGSPLIGYDKVLPNLIHAAGFSGHGLMHAPITALLATALVKGDIANGTVRLPVPFASHTIALSAFDPARDFTHSHETMVL